MNNRFENMLLALGIDTHLAESLIQKKMTLPKLKQKNTAELIKLGLNNNVAENISTKKRPPIPINTLIKLLYESKRTCCVCRDNSRSVVVHHIKEWHLSKDHSEKNLIVLCLEHHNEAHTKKTISLNLTSSHLISLKKKWIEDVKNADALAVLGLSIKEYSRWDYFNHNRVFELFLDNKISNTEFKTTYTLRELGLLNKLGIFSIKNENKSQVYDFDYGYMLYYYMKELFESVLKTIPLVDITDKYTRKEILSLVKPGVYISFQGGFYFKSLSKNHHSKNQRRLCYYKRDSIKIEFEFDAYETTSNSAWGSHLRGKKTITPICFVKSVLVNNGLLVISTSCLAIGSYFTNNEYRKAKYHIS